MTRSFLADDDLSPAEQAAVLDLAARSVVWDEAENRRHAQKAIIAWLPSQSGEQSG
jgi:ornithine carbamoyltransferase